MTAAEKAKELIEKATAQYFLKKKEEYWLSWVIHEGASCGDTRAFVKACDPQTITEICERMIRLEEALERYRNTQLLIREGNAIVQIKNGHGEWINTVPLYADETWVLGDIAREALSPERSK